MWGTIDLKYDILTKILVVFATIETMSNKAYLLSSSSRSLASISLLGGYFGKLDGSQGRGFVVKNWNGKVQIINPIIETHINEVNYLKLGVRSKGYKGKLKVTSLLSADAADPRFSGSIERSLSTRAKAEEGKSLNVSATKRLYRCWGLKLVAWGNFDFCQ